MILIKSYTGGLSSLIPIKLFLFILLSFSKSPTIPTSYTHVPWGVRILPPYDHPSWTQLFRSTTCAGEKLQDFIFLGREGMDKLNQNTRSCADIIILLGWNNNSPTSWENANILPVRIIHVPTKWNIDHAIDI
jgi:hypothetical protein